MSFRIAGVVWQFADRAGLNRAYRKRNAGRLLAVSYHGVLPPAELVDRPLSPDLVSTADLARQLESLVRHYQPLSISDLTRWYHGDTSFTRPPALITFDDGFRNNLLHAAPILTSMGIPALFNVCTGHVGTDRMLWSDEIIGQVLSWPEPSMPLPNTGARLLLSDDRSECLTLADRLVQRCKRIPHTALLAYLEALRRRNRLAPGNDGTAFMSWDEVRQMKKRGFDIGSHTVDHPVLTQIPASEIAAQMTNSKRELEHQLGSECSCIAYPNGGPSDVSPAVTAAARVAGYTFGFTVSGGMSTVNDDALALDRTYVGNGTSMAEFRSRTSGFHFALKRICFPGPDRTSNHLTLSIGATLSRSEASRAD